MASFAFIHAADLHLDTPFHGIAAESPQVRELLVEASLRCWDSLVKFAIERQVAFVLLAGDLYDGAERGVRAQIRVRAGLDRLSKAGIRTFIVHGNHDPLDGWRAAGALPEGVTVFGHADVEGVPVLRGEETLAIIYGISFGRQNVQENLALKFKRGSPDGIHIGLLHCMVGESADHGRYSPCSVEDLRSRGMDYWALGHVHLRQTLAESSPWIVYPGNLQGRSAKQSELGPKGALLVDVRDNVICTPEFVPLDCVRFVRCEVDVSGAADVGDLRDTVLSRLDDLRHSNDGRSLVVRVILSGRGIVHQDLAGREAMRELRDALTEELAGYQPLVWIESIQDETRALLDRDVIRARGDFCSELLLSIDALSGNERELRELTEEQWPSSTRKSLQSLGVQYDGEELRLILERAECLALDLLEGEPNS